QVNRHREDDLRIHRTLLLRLHFLLDDMAARDLVEYLLRDPRMHANDDLPGDRCTVVDGRQRRRSLSGRVRIRIRPDIPRRPQHSERKRCPGSKKVFSSMKCGLENAKWHRLCRVFLLGLGHVEMNAE
ncbi:hypothetical protein PMAYCL1PPCAC_28145, partial [Pristionchus mayeri]